MKRAVLRRRSSLRRGSRRLGQAALERVKAGGKLAVGRASETRSGWLALVRRCLVRADGRCEWTGSRQGPLDPHHVRARSAGGPDTDDNVVILGREAHELVSAPYRRGRLIITALSGGKFCFKLLHGAHKGAPLQLSSHVHTPAPTWLLATGRFTERSPEVTSCPA